MTHGHTKESLIAFEQGIVRAFADGDLPFLVHLSGGNEDQLIDIFRNIRPTDWVFSNHRSHYHALLKGIPDDTLEQFIRDGKSMFVFDRERRFYTSSILAGTCAIAAGVAWSIKQAGGAEKVFCFLGDGAEDNGHFAEAVRWCAGHDLPCQFIIEDNARQVDTSYAERWGGDRRMHWGPNVRRYFYNPTFPHGGAGLPPGSVTFKPEVVARFAADAGP